VQTSQTRGYCTPTSACTVRNWKCTLLGSHYTVSAVHTATDRTINTSPPPRPTLSIRFSRRSSSVLYTQVALGVCECVCNVSNLHHATGRAIDGMRIATYNITMNQCYTKPVSLSTAHTHTPVTITLTLILHRSTVHSKYSRELVRMSSMA